jgi:GNAT superfamily N-acetyltransferase
VQIALITSEDVLKQVYDRVLAPTFPPVELGSFASLAASWASGEHPAWAAIDDEGDVQGAVVCGRYPESRAALLVYLALAPGQRGGGVGGRLYREAVAAMMESGDVDLMLAEFEHPAVHLGSEETGDPVARLRFYDRMGGRGLAVPYFQPAIDGQRRVPGFILGVLSERTPPMGDGAVDGATVQAFLIENLRLNEGAVHDDPATTALLAAAGVPRVKALPLTEPDRIPVCQEA